MRKFLLSALVVLFAFASQAQKYRKYPYKSGKVEYLLSGNTTGKQITYWDQYGYNEVTIEETTTKMFGQTIVENSTTLILGNDQYEWNNTDDRVFKMSNPIAETWEENGYDDDDVQEFSIETMKALGYEKVGTETIQGKKCDLYTGMGKIWVWEGLPLKTEIKLLGTVSIIEAKDIDTNCKVPSSVFDLPANREVVENMDFDTDSHQQHSESENEEIDPEELKEGVENALKNLFGGN